MKEYSNKNYGLSPVTTARMVASPKISGSKFSTGVLIGRSPQMNKKIPQKVSSFKGLHDITNKQNKQNILSKFKSSGGSKVDTKVVDHEEIEPTDIIVQEEKMDKATVNVNRKQRNIFKNIESFERSPKDVIKNTDEDLPILEGIKTLKKKKTEEE